MSDLDDLDAYIIHVAELQTEIERLNAEKLRTALDVMKEVTELRAEIERLRAYAQHERSLGAEGPMIELVSARQENERLKAELERANDPTWARAALEQKP